jgi:hypothetical protein
MLKLGCNVRALISAGTEFGLKQKVEDELFCCCFIITYKYYETKMDIRNIAGAVVTNMHMKPVGCGFKPWYLHFFMSICFFFKTIF